MNAKQQDIGTLTRAHYERHPYPAGAVVDWSPHARAQANFVCGRRGAAALPQNARILVAGCGTREAVVWALACPEAEVHGVDFSAASLTQAARLATALGVRNVTFRQVDLMDARAVRQDAPFDLVVAFGVVHHLADPAAGLRHLREALTPDGLLLVMVYSATHREPVRTLERVGARLAGPRASGDERMAGLVGLAEALAGHPGPLREPLEALAEQAAHDPAALWDTFGHPHYRTYSIAGLWRLLAQAGLRFAGWARPGDWDVANYLDPGPLAARFQALSERQRYATLDALFAPLFVLYAERHDRPRPPLPRPYEADAAAWLDFVLAPAVRYRVTLDDAGRPGPVQRYGPTVRIGPQGTSVSFMPGLRYEDDAALAAILREFDGERPLGAVVAAAAARSGTPREALQVLGLRAARALVSPHEALVPGTLD